MAIRGIPGIKLIARPPTTRKMGNAIFTFLDSITNNRMTISRQMYCSKELSMENSYLNLCKNPVLYWYALCISTL
jgi:hypothetical protein